MSAHCHNCDTSEACVALLDCPQLMYSSPSVRESHRCNKTKKFCCPILAESRFDAPQEDAKFPEDCGTTPWYEVDRVVGGTEVQPDEFSWLVSLEYGNIISGICGGSIVNARYVLTAAHCVTGKGIDDLGGLKSVRVGNFTEQLKCDYGTEGCQQYQRFRIDEVIVHRGYIVNFVERIVNDIALVRLKTRIEFTSMLKPICLPIGTDRNIPEATSSTPLVVTGWGRTSIRTDNVAKRAVSMPMWTQDRCLQDPRRDETLICTGVAGKGSCHGDSGGPVMYQFENKRMVLEGIVSYGFKECALPSLPGVATRVRSFGSWIERNMRMN
ncbi:hypothetical protein KR093_002780 [Drosophila rubida]|uniref:Peptidase S1 domain-containing protein n=1 Tax=Drosophila rubida TaxID=30044 RepID=A0AAD4JSN7_9MUSC|nr:hypothetical protein KR093_002780 [Drosophila rubida]